MATIRRIALMAVALMLGACAMFEPGTSAEDEAAAAAAERAAVEAELEAQRVEQERLLAEERARAEADRRAQAERQAAEQARVESERQAAAEAEARRQREQQPSVEERARAVARQQERIAELREQIAATQVETTNLEAANATLRDAIAAAEQLILTLTEEQEKYAATDPATGATTEALSKERIAALNAELERLQAQAAALGQARP